MSDDPPVSFKYWAFISYSHRDRKWGDWLHRELETFKVPKKLIGAPTTRGEAVPKRLFPVFRDREELPTSSDLGTQINQALESSRYLVVICSPKAAQSRWVNEEILAFKRSGRSSRILALIVGGEPNASQLPGREKEECFPEALRYEIGPDGALTSTQAEPIAADLRRQGDGKESAFLKLAAGLLGVGFDDLRQRDAERRVKRLRAMLTLVSLLSAVFVALGVALYFQRKEAQEKGQEARDTLGQGAYVLALERIDEEKWSEAFAHLAHGIRHAEHRYCGIRAALLLQQRSWPRPAAPPIRLGQGGIQQARVAAEGKRIVAATHFGQISVFDFSTSERMFPQIDLSVSWKERLGDDPEGYPSWKDMRILDLDVSADGKRIAVVDGYYGDEGILRGHSLRLLDLETGTELGQNSRIGTVSLSPDGTWAISHTLGWEALERFSVLRAPDLSATEREVSQDARFLPIRWTDPDHFLVCDSTRFQKIHAASGEISVSWESPWPVSGFTLRPDGKEVVAWNVWQEGDPFQFSRKSLTDGSQVDWEYWPGKESYIQDVQYTEDGLPRLLQILEGSVLRFSSFERYTGAAPREMTLPLSGQLLPGGGQMFGVDAGGVGYLFDLSFDRAQPMPRKAPPSFSFAPPENFSGPTEAIPDHFDRSPYPDSHINDLAYSPDGRLLAVAAGDALEGGFIGLWDASSGKFLTTLVDPFDEVSGEGFPSVSFSPDSRLLLATFQGTGGFLFDLETERRISDSFLRHGTWTPGGEKLQSPLDQTNSMIEEWDVAPPGTPPVWFAELLEAIGGLTLPTSGVPESVENRFALLQSVQDRLPPLDGPPPEDPWESLAHWFLQPAPHKRPSSSSPSSIPEPVSEPGAGN